MDTFGRNSIKKSIAQNSIYCKREKSINSLLLHHKLQISINLMFQIDTTLVLNVRLKSILSYDAPSWLAN